MIRYKIIRVALFAFGVFVFIACHNQQGTKSTDNGLLFDTIAVNEQYFLDDIPTNPSCNISLSFVYPSGENKQVKGELQQIFVRNVFGITYDSLSPADAAKEYVRNYIVNYKSDAKTYREHIKAASQPDVAILYQGSEHDDEETLPKVFYSYYETLSDSIVYNTNQIISFQVKQSNNKGGAMSYNSYRNYVVNLATGALMTENDIFNPGYDMALQTLFINSLLAQNDVKTVAELEELGYFGIEEMIPNKNFLITDKGITYTFNKGEYSAYQLSAPVIFIPYGDVRSLLRSNTLVSKLAGL